MKKIIILFSDVFNTGGIETYNRYLRAALEAEFKEINFAAITLNTQTNITPKFVRKTIFICKTFFTIFSKKPILLICGHVSFAPIGNIFKKLYKIRYAVLTHGIEVWELKEGIKYNGLKNADIVTTVSKYTKNRMAKNGIPEGKIKLLQDTIDTSVFYPKAPNLELKNKLALQDKRVLLTVGRISSREKYKGHDIVLEVLRKLDDRYIWLVAGGGDDLPRLKAKARKMGIFEKIRFVGCVKNEELIDYYNLCDVFVMPSKGEGFGIVFLEAMACGKPVIAGNKDGSAEPLMDGKLGFLVDPDNVDEIIKVINLACTTKEDKTDPNSLRKQVEVNFGIEVFNKRVKEVFSASLRRLYENSMCNP